jgi:hypothetical protein
MSLIYGNSMNTLEPYGNSMNTLELNKYSVQLQDFLTQTYSKFPR